MGPASLRVLHLPQGYWPDIGGGEVLARQVSEALARRGHRVRVLVPWTMDLGGTHRLRARGRPDVEIHGGVVVQRGPRLGRFDPLLDRCSRKGFPLPGRGSVRAWTRRARVRRFFRLVSATIVREQPDVVLAMMHDQISMRAAAAARAGLAFPLVMAPQLHDEAPGWPREAVRRLLASADVVTANTRHEQSLLASAYGVPPDRLVLTGGGTTPPAAVAPWPRPPHVLFLGRLHRDKGLVRIVDAMEIVWARRPEARLVLVGPPDRDMTAIEARLAALPPTRRAQVDRTGPLEADALHRVLCEATCLLLPSRHESFGLVLVEAQAHGTPPVTWDLPVFGDTVHDGQDGLLVTPDDTDALATAVLRLLDDPALAERLGRAGRAGVLERHTWDHVAARYEEALRRAIQRAPAAGPAQAG